MPKGYKHSEEAKRKISLATSGERNPMYGRSRRGEVHRRGYNLSDFTKQKQSESRLLFLTSTTPEKRKELYGHFAGKKHSPETLKKMSDSAKRRKPRVFSEQARDNISKAIAKSFIDGKMNHVTRPSHYKSGWFDSDKTGMVFFRSALEMDSLKIVSCCPSIRRCVMEPFSLEYANKGGKVRRYIPDMLIYFEDGRKWLVEIKPWFQTQDPENHLKWASALEWAKKNQARFVVWTEKGLNDLWEQAMEDRLIRQPIVIRLGLFQERRRAV